MPLLSADNEPLVLRLNRDLIRTIKRGHPWVFADALRELPQAPAGAMAVLLDNRKGQPIATGLYDPSSPLAFRVCDPGGRVTIDDRWVERRLRDAVAIRHSLFDSSTTGYRLFNGEGDGVPGLVVDVYDRTAVMKLDGAGPAGFWNAQGIAEWICREAGMTLVYERHKSKGSGGRVLCGKSLDSPVSFLENGQQFTADIVQGQKTGFFLDQRDNRHLIRDLSHDKTVLNLFSYTGGFSIAAGSGGARHVTSVDVAHPAIEAATTHWELNGLPESSHEGVTQDVFEFLAQATSERKRWQIVVVDPPSFAPNQESVASACSAYESLIAASAKVAARGGLLAAASCSSHIDLSLFLKLCEEGVSEARRRGTVLSIKGQPADHPSPLALPEFRYLKFVLLRLD